MLLDHLPADGWRIVAVIHEQHAACPDSRGRFHIAKGVADHRRAAEDDLGMVTLCLKEKADPWLPALTRAEGMRTVIDPIQPGTSSSQLVAQGRVDLFEVLGTHPAERHSALIGDHDRQDPKLIQKFHCVGSTLEQFELVDRLDVVAWPRRAIEDPIAV